MIPRRCRNCAGSGCSYCNNKGIVYAEVDDPEPPRQSSEGFFSRLFGGKSDNEDDDPPQMGAGNQRIDPNTRFPCD